MEKKIEAIFTPREPHFVGDGFRVHNFIPSFERLSMQRMDPFILLDYNSKFHFPPSEQPKGVGVHPHRGFETVTIAYKGSVAHHDSHGGSGVIGEGDVQWMTAGSGVLHKEYHEESFSKEGGDFQMVQLWVNLPAKDKMSKPKYQAITKDAMTKVSLADGQGEVEVIAGSYDGNQGPASTFSPVHLYNVKLKKGGKAEFSLPENYNTVLLSIEGSAIINNSDKLSQDHLALLANEGTDFMIEGSEDCTILLLSGEPLGEPISAHGPFVMNTKEEIAQAFQDYNSGGFGQLS